MNPIEEYELKQLKKKLRIEKGKLKDLVCIAEIYQFTGKESLGVLLKRAKLLKAYSKQSEYVTNLEREVHKLKEVDRVRKGIKTVIVCV